MPTPPSGRRHRRASGPLTALVDGRRDDTPDVVSLDVPATYLKPPAVRHTAALLAYGGCQSTLVQPNTYPFIDTLLEKTH